MPYFCVSSWYERSAISSFRFLLTPIPWLGSSSISLTVGGGAGAVTARTINASTFAQKVRESEPRRDPPYRPAMYLTEEEKAELDQKIGDANLYQDLFTMREMVLAQPENIELKRALVSGIASAEFAGIDAFSKKVVEWQEWPVPPTLIMAIARQTWDEVRHAQLAKGLIENYGAKIGDFPDTLAGGAPPNRPATATNGVAEGYAALPEELFRDPVVSLSMTNVSLEGGALTLFQETSAVAEKIGDNLMAHCYDYNWADEVRTLKGPVLLVYGDSDMFRPEHIVEFYHLLGGGLKDAGWQREHMSQNRLAILPDVTHYEMAAAPALVPTVLPFLNGKTGPK